MQRTVARVNRFAHVHQCDRHPARGLALDGIFPVFEQVVHRRPFTDLCLFVLYSFKSCNRCAFEFQNNRHKP